MAKRPDYWKTHPHIAPFGRDCVGCGRWLDKDRHMLEEAQRPTFDDKGFPTGHTITIQVYQCPDCGIRQQNKKVVIYD